MADIGRRRRSEPKAARDLQLSIRLSASEYDEVKQVADGLVLDASAYARSVLLRVCRGHSVSVNDMKLPSARGKQR